VETSNGSDQYWTVAPPAPVYAVDAATSPAAAAAAASYFSPMFFQVRCLPGLASLPADR